MIIASADWPTFGWVTDPWLTVAAAVADRCAVVLGTLVNVEGSSPRPAGAQMVFEGAAATGYFSGGCLEADVANHAADVLRDGRPRLLVYGRGSPWIDIRLTCGGRLEILLERLEPYDPMVEYAICMHGNRHRFLWSSDGKSRQVSSAPRAVPTIRWNGIRYDQCHDPSWRIAIVGGDPIALAIAQLAAASGFETIVIRPNGPRSSPPNFVMRYSREDPARAIHTLDPDPWTAIVTATHDDTLDDAAILAGLGGDASYVGVLGSAKRTAARRERMLHAGVPPERLAALHARIGAVRSGKAPWEVAVSVVAEIMELRNDLAEIPRTETKTAAVIALPDSSRYEPPT